MTSEYEILFAMADVFIDSFPVGAALTQIELMRLKIPSVVKINTKNPSMSFHEYMPSDYEYMSDKENEIIQFVNMLLDNPTLRKKASQKSHEYYLSKYEGTKNQKIYNSFLKKYKK